MAVLRFSGADVHRSVPGRFRPGLLFFLLCLLPAAANADEVFFRVSVLGSSEPVPVYDMVNGWGDSVKSGDYAYADARINIGFELSQWEISYERRWYYNLRFNDDTARFYSNVNADQLTNEVYNLYLDVQGMALEGGRFSKSFGNSSWLIKPSFVFYRVNEFQIGKVAGQVVQDGTEFSDLLYSVYIDYHYDQDKILGHDDPIDSIGFERSNPGLSFGVSADLSIGYRAHSWAVDLMLQDGLNHFYFEHSPYTRYCTKRTGELPSFCSADTEDRTGHENNEISIPFSISMTASYTPIMFSLSAYHHDRYQRLSARKSWPTMIGTLGVSAHSTRQFGLHWSSRWHELSVAADDADWQAARELQLQLGLRFPW